MACECLLSTHCRRWRIGYLELMDRAFLLQHENPDTEDVKVIGVYSSEAEARAAIERLRSQPGFCEHPRTFTVDGYELDRDHWVEGFASQ